MQEGTAESATEPEPTRQVAAVADELAREIKRRRLAAGSSQRELATRIGYSRQYVSMTEWEDANLPSRELVTAIDAALGADGALVAMRDQIKRDQKRARLPAGRRVTVGDADERRTDSNFRGSALRHPTEPSSTTTDFDPVVHREQLGEYLRSQRMTDDSVRGYTEVSRVLAAQRQSVAPGALLGPIEAHRDTVSTLFREATEYRMQEQLGSLLGETSIVASRIWSAVGDRAMALSHCAFARKLADRLHDPFMGGISRIFESNLRSDAATLIGSDGDVIIGLRILKEAAIVADRLPPAARARIGAEQAQAYAVLELERECNAALSRAYRAVEVIDQVDRTGLFSDWDTTRLRVYEGTCWLLLDKPRKAISTLNEALDVTGDGNRNIALAAQVDLASAYNQSGELEEGCRVLGDTYTSLVAMGNQRGIERAQRAIERTAPWRSERPVRELREQIEALDGQ